MAKQKEVQPVTGFQGLMNNSWRKNLFAEINGASLVFFRMLFGLIMLVEVYRYFDHGWIARYWIKPEWNFTYFPFDWLHPFPGNGMYFFFAFMGLVSICIALGAFYRIASVLFFLGFGYIFLLEQTTYLNHFYLIVLLAFILIFLPLNRRNSIDVILFPKLKKKPILNYHLWLLRFMITIPYFFGGVAKINPDWLTGHPLDAWLSDDTSLPLIGQFLDDRWMVLFISYSGLLLDLLILPFLLIRKTRLPAFILITIFHICNSIWFSIGVFPWLMIVATLIFFPPTWPKDAMFKLGMIRVNFKPIVPKSPETISSKQQRTLSLLTAWFLLMSLLPMRHLLYPGNVSWTEEGHRFAWHMKLRSKRGKGYFVLRDKNTGIRFKVNSGDYLSSRQQRKMITRPYLIWQFAQKIKAKFDAEKTGDFEVFAFIQARLNGRDYQQLIDPSVDLTGVGRPVFNHSTWIVPFND